jgi:hypothetical protein
VLASSRHEPPGSRTCAPARAPSLGAEIRSLFQGRGWYLTLTESLDAAGGARAAGATPGRVVSLTRISPTVALSESRVSAVDAASQ